MTEDRFELPQLPTKREYIENMMPYAKNALDTWKRYKRGEFHWYEQYKEHTPEFIDSNIKYFEKMVSELEKNLKKAKH